MRSSMFDDGGKRDRVWGNPLSESLYSELSLALSRADGVGLDESLARPCCAGRRDPAQKAPAARRLSVSGRSRLRRFCRWRRRQSKMPVAGPIALPGRVSSSYGWRKDPVGPPNSAKGTDIAGQSGPRPGREVSFAGQRSGAPEERIDHGTGVSRGPHLSPLPSRRATPCQPGRSLPSRGRRAGDWSAPSFEVLEDGQAVDPSAWRSPSEQ
jgi:hypothetical protein